jgi:hypothetical protein
VTFDLEKEHGGVPKTGLKYNEEIIIENNFRFFEIETLLRNICYDTFEPLRVRII